MREWAIPGMATGTTEVLIMVTHCSIAKVAGCLVVLILLAPGCGGAKLSHARIGWKAEEFFEDPQVVALCHAIEANDLEEIDRIIAAGADVNAVGKGGVTPLLWAYPGNNLTLFEHILAHGADPNVKITEAPWKRVNIRTGDTVMSMCAKTAFAGYLEAVLEYGGDPNMKDSWGDYPLHSVVTHGGNKIHRIQLLLDAGADVNKFSGGEVTPAMDALSHGGQYALAKFLLEHGTDLSLRRPTDLRNFPEFLAAEEDKRSEHWTAQQKQEFAQLVEHIENNGYSMNTLREDHMRWKKWFQEHKFGTKLKDSLMYRELQQRAAAEAAEKEANE